jgi:hypothetical protein
VTRLFLGAAEDFATGAGWAFGSAASTASDVMSGVGAGAAVRIWVGSGCQGLGTPWRWLVTTARVPFSSIVPITNSDAPSSDFRFWPIADIPSCTTHVCFAPETGHGSGPIASLTFATTSGRR